MSKGLRPAELCVCRMVFGSLFVVICGFLLLNAIETPRFGRSTPVSKVAIRPEPGNSIVPHSERPKAVSPLSDNSDPRPQKKPSGGAEPDAAEPVSPAAMKVRLERLGAMALERMVRFDSQPFEQHAGTPALGFAEAASRPILTESFQANPEKRIETASASASASPELPLPNLHQELKIAEQEDTPAQRKVEEASPAAESLTEQQILRVKSKLRDLGFLSSARGGGWDASARNALRDFKVANRLPIDDVWDVETSKKIDSRAAVRADDSIIGNWSAAPCRSAKPSDTRLSVSSRRAKSSAGSVCEFQDLKVTAHEWRVKASCSQGEKRWTAKGKFSLSADKLVWSSEHDVISYFRCKAVH